ALWNEADDSLKVAVARGWFSNFTKSSVVAHPDIFEKVFVNGEIYFSKDLASDSLASISPGSGQIPAGWGGICIPIRDEQRIIGVLLMAVPGEWELSKNEIRLLSTLAEMMGSVLRRMVLHEQTEQRLQNIVALSVIDKAISSSRDIQFIL